MKDNMEKIYSLIEKCKYQIVSVSFLFMVIISMEILPDELRVPALIFAYLINLIILIMYSYTNYEKLTLRIRKNYSILFRFIFIPIITIITIEIINYSGLSYLKLPFLFLFNYSLILTNFIVFINNYEDLIEIINKVRNFTKWIIIYSIAFSIINILLPNSVQWFNNKKYLISDYVFSISTRQHIIGGGFSGRYSSIYINVNRFAELAYIYMFFILLSESLTDKKSSRRYLIFEYLLVFIVVLLTKSRNSLISLFLFISVYFIITKSEKVMKKYLPVALLLIIPAIYICIVYLYNVNSIGDIFNNRLEITKISLDIFREHPFVGVGTKTFNDILDNDYNYTGSHNTFMQLLASGGIIYFIIYVASILRIFFHYRLKFDRKSDVIVSFFISLIFYQLFENRILSIYFMFNVIILLFYLYIVDRGRIFYE